MAGKRNVIDISMGDVVDAICQRFCINRDDIWKIEKGCETFFPGNYEQMEKEVLITTYRRNLKRRKR